MPDTSDFDVTTPRQAAPRRGNLVAALLLGLLLVGGFIALWVAYGSAPPQQPQADVAANASNETAQVIRDLQTAIKGLQTTDEKVASQLQSVQQTLASNQAETKRLADQVTALSGKFDALQQSFASAQRQSSPASSEPPPPAPAKRRR
jgi:septal ring factor EnvC (AmiA/AmiB activator)